MSSLEKIDLNLLKTLDLLLEERSVSNAALRLYRTQSAVSHALQKLREIFGDPLLVRDGWQMRLTEKATLLQQPVRNILMDIQVLFENNQQFDPRTSHRVFNIAVPEYCMWLMQDFIVKIKSLAPHTTVNLITQATDISDVQSCSIDLMLKIGSKNLASGIESYQCGTVVWGILANTNHPISADPTIKEWSSYDQIAIESISSPDTKLSDIFITMNINKIMVVKSDNFWSLIPFLKNSNSVITTLCLDNIDYQSLCGLKMVKCPLSLSSYNLTANWLTQREYSDSAIKWLIREFKELTFPPN